MNLIAISKTSNDAPFLSVVRRLRRKAEAKTPTMEEITKEVESVRLKRYASKKA